MKTAILVSVASGVLSQNFSTPTETPTRGYLRWRLGRVTAVSTSACVTPSISERRAEWSVIGITCRQIIGEHPPMEIVDRPVATMCSSLAEEDGGNSMNAPKLMVWMMARNGVVYAGNWSA